MERINKLSVKVLIASIAVWATACSEVSFEPGKNNIEPFVIPETEQKETFNFNDDGVKAKVDILFVVDNSGSMLEEQGKLGTALSSFITSLGNIDWQIGVTTTDISNGPWGRRGSLEVFQGTNTKLLKNSVAGFEAIFQNTVVREELVNCKANPDNPAFPCPSVDERALEAITMAFAKKGTDNKGFFRSGADVATVILTDEDEGSDGTNAIPAAAVVDSFVQHFGGEKTLSAYGIIIEPGDTNCFNKNSLGGGAYGNYASALAQLTDGETGSICDNDYGPTLTSIGNRVKNMVKSVTLRYTPDLATVQIVMAPNDPSITWQVIGNVIRFSKTPAKGTRVEVTYMPLQPDEPI